jgi:hypothetical protein
MATGSHSIVSMSAIAGAQYVQVTTFADLPSASLFPGEIYLVKQTTGTIFLLNQRRAGLWLSDGATWERLGDLQSQFTTTNFVWFDDADNTKKTIMDLSALTTGAVRTITMPDADVDLGAISGEPNIVKVTQASDIPATLLANTTYIVNGQITMSGTITVTNAGSTIIGRDRVKDGLIYTGTGTLITVTDVDFSLQSLGLSATTTGSELINATNYSGGAFNEGRTKVLTLVDCQIRNCFDVMDVEGFDLVDIQNTLFWYVQAPNFGVRFLNTSKVEISSCEFIRWFDETTIPTPSGHATCPMIELSPNGAGAGFGAVNINGCVIHAQVTQDGVKIHPLSTVGAGGTITGNTFVGAGLTTGLKFFPDPLAGGFSNTELLKHDVSINQGIPDSNSYMLVTFTGNTTNTALSTGVPAIMNAGTNAVATNSQRMTTTTDGVVTYNGTKDIYVSMIATINFDKQGGGTDDYNFYFYKDTGSGFAQLTDSISAIRVGGDNFVLPMSYSTTLSAGDQLAIYIENPVSNDDMRVTDLQWSIIE